MRGGYESAYGHASSERCDPRTGREPPKSGPSLPPPGRLYWALIKSIKAEPMHHCRATDTILHILLCTSRMLTTRYNEACNERAQQRPQPGLHPPRLTPPCAQQPPWHPRCRDRARFRRRWRQCPPPPPPSPGPGTRNRGRERPRRARRERGGRRAPSTEKMVMTPPRGCAGATALASASDCRSCTRGGLGASLLALRMRPWRRGTAAARKREEGGLRDRQLRHPLHQRDEVDDRREGLVRKVRIDPPWSCTCAKVAGEVSAHRGSVRGAVRISGVNSSMFGFER